MPVLAIFLGCFLFFCGHSHTHTARHRATTDCTKIVQGFHYAGDKRDDYVKSFPVGKQHDVLVCLDKGTGK